MFHVKQGVFMIRQKKQFETAFYDISNIIYSMANVTITSLNLIIESLEVSDCKSVLLMEDIIESINENMISIDCLNYTVLSEYTCDIYGRFWDLVFIADVYERVGNLCHAASAHVRTVIDFSSDYSDILNEILMFLNHVRFMLTEITNYYFQQNSKSVRIDMQHIFLNLQKEKDALMVLIVNKIENFNGYSPLFTELLFLIKNFFEISEVLIKIPLKVGRDGFL